LGFFFAVFTSLADDHAIAVFSGDAVGHGRSTGPRAYFDSFSILVDDFQSLADAASTEINSISPESVPVPMFVCGHSLGGLVAAFVLLQSPTCWAGLLLCSPALDVEWTPILRVQAALGNVLSAVVPKARIVPAVHPQDINQDPVKVKAYIDDPLNTVGPLPARTGNEGLKVSCQGFFIPFPFHIGIHRGLTISVNL